MFYAGVVSKHSPVSVLYNILDLCQYIISYRDSSPMIYEAMMYGILSTCFHHLRLIYTNIL